MTAKPTLYWHDYETFGADPRRDRAAQFAGVRTDEDLNIIGEPLNIHCRPADDFLPQPLAVLITGITPQQCLQQGLPEVEFIGSIHEQLALPGTCGVGYNTLRFDDEVTRNLLYRNFYDPYAREWQNGNSRWDILDMMRLMRAVRPEGINWPNHDDGKPSFKLEHLTAANGLQHAAAHDALSDVLATIAVAKLVKQAQPKLYEYVYQLRDKRKVAEQLDVVSKKPVLHISGMYPAERGCLALVAPIGRHPVNQNEIVVFDLSADPAPLFELSAEQLRQRVFTRAQDLPEGVTRLPLKTIHINKCPIVASAKLLTPELAEKWQVDLATARQNWLKLCAHELQPKLDALFKTPEREAISDPDLLIYSGGFFSGRDKAAIAKVRTTAPQDLPRTRFDFDDPRLPEMLFRYRARNYPETLSREERGTWDEYRNWRLTDPAGGASIVLDDYLAEIERLSFAAETSDAERALLEQLMEYAEQVVPDGA